MIYNTLVAAALSVPLTPEFIVKDAQMIQEAMNLIESDPQPYKDFTQVHYEVPQKAFITTKDASSAIDEITALQNSISSSDLVMSETWVSDSIKEDLDRINDMLNQNLMTVDLGFPNVSLDQYWNEAEVQAQLVNKGIFNLEGCQAL